MDIFRVKLKFVQRKGSKRRNISWSMGTTKKKFPKPKHYGEKKTFLRAEGGEKDREKIGTNCISPI